MTPAVLGSVLSRPERPVSIEKEPISIEEELRLTALVPDLLFFFVSLKTPRETEQR